MGVILRADNMDKVTNTRRAVAIYSSSRDHSVLPPGQWQWNQLIGHIVRIRP